MAENYFIVGEEVFLVEAKVQETINKFSGQDDWSLERLSGWRETKAKLLNTPLFAEQRIFLLEYEALAEDKPEPDQVSALLPRHDNILIIYARSKLDQRTRLYKEVSKNAKLIPVIAPKRYELTKWVLQRGKELGAEQFEREAAENLIFLSGANMLVLDNELRKLVNYSPEINVENVQKLAARDMQTNIFELVDFVVQAQAAKAQAVAESMIRTGAEIPYVLHMLGRQYRLLFKFLFYRQQGWGNAEIQKLMPRMHPYAFQKLTDQAVKVSINQCASSLQTILEADYAYKTGNWQGVGMLQVLLVKLAKK